MANSSAVALENRQSKARGKSSDRNQAGRPTTAELERRKIVVMEVATELFVAHGYAGTSLVDIAKQAGVATRTLYQHFGDKEAIFREVIFARRSAHLIPSLSCDPALSTFDQLMAAAHSSINYAIRGTSLDLMRLMVGESRRFPDLMKRVATATFARFNENIAVVFSELAAANRIPDDDHLQSARVFLDLVIGNTAMLHYMGWEMSHPDEAMLEAKVEMFILGRFGPDVAASARTSPAR